jgi:hypothetical protein
VPTRLRSLPTNHTELAAIHTAQQLADILHLSQLPIRELRGYTDADGIHLPGCLYHRTTSTLISRAADAGPLQLAPCCDDRPAENLVNSLTPGSGPRQPDGPQHTRAGAATIAEAADTCRGLRPWPGSDDMDIHYLHRTVLSYRAGWPQIAELRWLEPILSSIIDHELAGRDQVGPLTTLVGAGRPDRLWGAAADTSTCLLRARSAIRYPGTTPLIATDDAHYITFTEGVGGGPVMRPLLHADTPDQLDVAAHTLRTLLADHPLDDNLLRTVAALHPGVTAHPDT